jgi:Ca2+-binding RTX toxin-like protein
MAIRMGGIGNDILTGTALKDTLNGGAGADIMRGGKGNDTYVVDNVGDVVIEGAGFINGVDKVLASIKKIIP